MHVGKRAVNRVGQGVKNNNCRNCDDSNMLNVELILHGNKYSEQNTLPEFFSRVFSLIMYKTFKTAILQNLTTLFCLPPLL